MAIRSDALVSLVFARNIVSCTMVGRRSDNIESGGEVYPILKGNGFEGYQSLVMIHCQDRIVFAYGFPTRKNRRLGKVRKPTFLCSFDPQSQA